MRRESQRESAAEGSGTPRAGHSRSRREPVGSVREGPPGVGAASSGTRRFGAADGLVLVCCGICFHTTLGS